MNAPIEQWGRRLSDALREALGAGDLAAARALVTQGDGQARNLASEYAFMVRGLGITVRVLMDLLAETADRLAPEKSDAARDDAVGLVRRFAHDIARLPAGAPSQRASPPPPSGDRPKAPSRQGAGLAEAIAGACAALDECSAWFEQTQGGLADDVVRAIDAGDRVGAAALVDTKELGQYLPLHDRLIRFMAESFAWALRHGGSDGLLRFQLGAAQGQRQGFEKWERMPAAQFAWTSAFLLKQHMGRVSVREDEARFTIEQSPCGSGGRLRLLGAYEGPDALPFVETPGPLTFGQPRLPVYCSHCPIWNASATLRWFGRAHWVFERPARADGGCTLHVYKRREDTPEDFVRQVSLEAREG